MKPYYEHAGIVIYLGDCREILPQLEPVNLILADPPYGIGYRHGAEKGPNASKFNNCPIVGDDIPFDPDFIISMNVPAILWGGNNYATRLPNSGGWLIWDKRVGTVVNDQSDCEIAWTNLFKTARVFYHVWDGFRRGPERNTPRVHPSQKPILLMKWCLGFAPEAEITLDPFMGSGTTLRAAKDLERKAIGIEIEEKYCEIAAKRLEQEVLPFDPGTPEEFQQGRLHMADEAIQE